MGNFGFKSGIKGENVLSTADKNINISSKYASLKVFKKGSISVTTDGSGNGTATISHGLGYAPTFFVWRKATAAWQKTNPGSPYDQTFTNAYFPNTGNIHSWVGVHDDTNAYTDSTNLYIKMAAAGVSTTYNFIYYILVDLAQAYSAVSPLGTNNLGMKVGTTGNNAMSYQDFLLSFSSRYQSLKYIPQISGTTTITLPTIFASQISDPNPQEATYVDIAHNLGYAPFYLVFYTSDDSTAFPGTGYAIEGGFVTSPTNILTDIRQVDTWCDAQRIRVTFFRRATYNSLTGVFTNWNNSETITIKYLIFNENLSLI